ncbi:hypothetical protein K439DRAFT_310777 [Ramaria rubella]|nr:hypothetical protein K439DRAFT_310777 [Ramaria rubella]
MLVHRGVECRLLLSNQWQGSFQERPRKADDPPDLIRAVVTMSSAMQFSIKWRAKTPITAWCEVKKTSPVRKEENLIAATYMNKFEHLTQTRYSSRHLQTRRLAACPTTVNYSELTGLGTIRLEIRRLLDDLVVKGNHLSGKCYKEDIDMTFIDDPRREMRPYITFEFKILLEQPRKPAQFGRHITVSDKTSRPSSIQQEEEVSPEDHRKRRKVNRSHQSIRKDDSVDSGGKELPPTRESISKLQVENAALASQVGSMVECMKLKCYVRCR